MHERLMSAGVRRTARAKKRTSSRVPIVSLGLLVLLAALCLLADLLAPGDPSYMNLAAALHLEIQMTNTDLAYFRCTLDIAFLAVVLLLH